MAQPSTGQQARNRHAENEIENNGIIRMSGCKKGRKATGAEPWPPLHGIPSQRRMKHPKHLRWGETPFDNLTRGELLRLVQAYHMALTSSSSVLRMSRINDETHPFWGPGGTGGRALAEADCLMHLCRSDRGNADSEAIYRKFFRNAGSLLFPTVHGHDRFYDWGVDEKGEWCAPNPGEDRGYRAVQWKDLHPSVEIATTSEK